MGPTARTAYHLTMTEPDADAPHTCGILETKAGGIGYVSSSESIPECGQCDGPMSLVAQVNLAQMPEEVQETLKLGE
ncbi:protein of unknown function DUF1963, partial [Kipferlia bialata]|eukprot:g12767.t1